MKSTTLITDMNQKKDKPMNKKNSANVKVALAAIAGVFCLCNDGRLRKGMP